MNSSHRHPALRRSLLLFWSVAALVASSSAMRAGLHHDVVITENRGQIVDASGKARPDILYVAEENGAVIYFTAQGPSFVFSEDVSQLDRLSPLDPDASLAPVTTKTYRSDLQLIDAAFAPRLRVENQTQSYTNYYLSHCPDGITGVRSYRRLVYENVYPNIDLAFEPAELGFRYDFIVRPGGNPENIRYRYSGDRGSLVQIEDGRLAVIGNWPLTATIGQTYSGSMRLALSDAATGIQRIPVGTVGSYTRPASGPDIAFATSFGAGAVYLLSPEEFEQSARQMQMKAAAEVTLVFATYLGGGARDYGNATVVDAGENIIFIGYTESTNFPVTSGAMQTTNAGPYDVVIGKFTKRGQQVWTTYYGGAQSDLGRAGGINPAGEIVVAGDAGNNFPLSSDAEQKTYGGSSVDGFIMRLNTDGTRIYASYIGGSGNDPALSMTLDRNGGAVIAGRTDSPDFPVTAGAFQSTKGASLDGYIAKFDASGKKQWATYYGATGLDQFFGVAVDKNNNIVMAGTSDAKDFPTSSSAYQPAKADTIVSDGVLVKFSNAGARLWATYLGGDSSDNANAVAIDSSNNIIVTGTTRSHNFPTDPTTVQPTYGGNSDAFVMKFDPNGAKMWGTYYGGVGREDGYGVVVDKTGNIYVAGNTTSADLTMPNSAVQKTIGGLNDVFLTRLGADGSWEWATYYGGTGDDRLTPGGLTHNGDSTVIFTGNTASTDFPVSHETFQPTSGGGTTDAFLVKFAPPVPPASTPTTAQHVASLTLETLAPNPSRDFIDVRFALATAESVDLTIYASDGSLVRRAIVSQRYQAGSRQERIDVRDLASGVYLLEVRTPSSTAVAPLRIVR